MVNRSELHALYWDERLSTRAIAEIHGVSHMTVKRWLRKHDIPRRPKGRGLANRGIKAPTAEELRQMVHEEHLSYREIGQRYGVDLTAVPLWLDKHEIEHPTIWGTRRKGSEPTLPDTNELAALLRDGISMREIGRRCGVSESSIAKRCHGAGLTVAAPGFNHKRRFRGADGHLVRSTYELFVCEWLHQRSVDHIYEPRVPFDKRYKADFLANGWYIEVWGVVGSPGYTERREKKCRLYAEHGLPLIEVPAEYFEHGQRHLLDAGLAPTCKSGRPPSQTAPAPPR